MRQSSLLRTFFLLATVAGWSAGCGDSETAGTFVKLNFEGSVSQEAPIQKLSLDVQLGGKTATTEFLATAQRPITLPTSSVLDIGSGEGAFLVTANAFSATGVLLGTGAGAGTVVKGKTAVVTVTFGPLVADAGIDLAPRIDGPAPTIDGTIDTGGRDAPSDRATDAPLGIDGPPQLDVAGPDGGTDVMASGSEVGVDAPGTGGAIGTGGIGGGTGGTTGTGGIGGGPGGITGTGGTGPDSGPGVYQLVANPMSVDFGVILPGNTSPPQTFTIVNRGDAPSPPLVLAISDPKTFPIYKDGCAGIALVPGANCTVTFTFTPGTTGPMKADGSVAPSGGLGAKFQLSGTGAGGPATLSLSPSAMTLPPVDVNNVVSINFTLTNGGDTEAGSITIQVPGAPVFQLTANGCGTASLGPRSQCAFTVAFAPTVFGPASTTVSVQSSLGLSASATIAGTGRDFVPLNIAFAGTGSGTVTGGPQSCASGNVCNFAIPRTDPNNIPQFVLTAQPNPLMVFAGWAGDCTGTGTCTVVMDKPHAVTATFNPQMVTLNLTVLGLAGQTGALTSADGSITCSGACPGLQVPASTAFTLNAKPGSGSTFAAWTSGPCKGIDPKCTFALTSTVSIVATFGPQSYMFVTSTTVVPGRLGGVEAADLECKTLAEKNALPGKYMAWLSTSTNPAFKRVGQGGWIRTDGRPFSRDLKWLTDPGYLGVLYPPRLDEHGTDLGNVRVSVATGSGPDGNPAGTQCEDYRSTAGDLFTGDASSGSAVWSSRGLTSAACGSPQHLYCFRSDLAAASISPAPQPGRRVYTTRLPFVLRDGLTPNELCWKDAEAGGISDPKTFVAFVATTRLPAMKLVSLTGPPWKRMDGVFIVDQPADLGNNKPLAPIDGTADGKGYMTGDVWTGAKEPRIEGTATCGDWSSTSTISTGISGDSPTSAAPDWFNYTTSPCASTTTRLICIEP